MALYTENGDRDTVVEDEQKLTQAAIDTFN